MKDNINYLDATCSNSLSRVSKISILSLQDKKSSKVSEIILLIIEYLQLASMTLLFCLDPATINQPQEPVQFTVLSVAKLLNPGYILTFEDEVSFTWLALAIILTYSAFRYLLFFYIVSSVYRNMEPNRTLVRVWKWIFKVQARIGYGIVTSFWLNAIQQAVNDDSTIFGAGKVSVAAICTILTVIEFIFCSYLGAHYYSILPTKNLLSSKNTITESLNLAQKFALQVLQIIFVSFAASNLVSRNWVLVSINLLFSFVRNIYYFRYIPLYNMHGLICQSFLTVVVAAFDISCFVQIVGYSSDLGQNLSFIITLWAIISILAMMISYQYLMHSVLNLAITAFKDKPDLLIQKLNTILELRKGKRSWSKSMSQFAFSQLIESTATLNLKFSEHDLGLNNEEKYSLSSKEYYLNMAINHLEAVLTKLPKKDGLIRLYLGKIYGKNLEQYGLAMKYLIQLQNSSNRIIAQNASVLIWHIQNKIQANSIKNKRKIDLVTYFSSQTKFIQLQRKIIKQNELQINLYQEMIEESPNLAKIFDYAQPIDAYRQKIEKYANRVIETIPSCYTLPTLIYTQYQILSNHSLLKHTKYNKIYTQKRLIYEKYFRIDDLLPENCYQDRTALVLVSGQKEDLGKIVFCTKALENIYEGDKSLYLGADISALAPLGSMNFYPLFSKSQVQEQDHTILSHSFQGYCNTKNDYLIKANFYIDVFPYLTRGFYYSILIRQVSTSEEYIIVDENGVVQGVTKTLSKQLGIKKSFNIGVLAQELAEINKAFNYTEQLQKESNDNTEVDMKAVQFKPRDSSLSNPNPKSQFEDESDQDYMEKKSPLDKNKAQELHSIFSAKGREVKLRKIREEESKTGYQRHGREIYSYDCRVMTLSKKTAILRLITLSEQKENHQINDFKRIQTTPEEIINRSPEKSKRKRFFEVEICPEDHPFDDEQIGPEDEKEAGWIDFGALRENNEDGEVSPSTHEDPIKSPTNVNILTTERGLLSPMSISSHRKLIPEVPNQVLRKFFKKEKSSKADQPLVDDGRNKQENRHLNDNTKAKQDGRINASVASSTLNTKFAKMHQAWDFAISSKFYVKSFGLFYVLFYALIIGLFISQVSLKDSVDNNADDMKVKSAILTNAQLRDYSLEGVYRVFRIIWDTAIGTFDSVHQPALPIPLAGYILFINNTLVTLEKTNQNLLQNSGLVDESLRSVLFQKDVRIFYNNTNETAYFLNFTDFQATDLMVSASLDALPTASINITGGAQSLDVVFRNAMNDPLIKNEAATEIFLKSIEKQVSQGEKMITSWCIIKTVLLISLLIIFIYLISFSYSEEKINMIALTKLDTTQIKVMQTRLVDFTKTLVTGNFDEDKAQLDNFQKGNMFYSGRKMHNRNSQSPNMNGILRKYMFLTSKAVIIFVGIIAIQVASALLANGSIDYLYAQQGRLYFVNNMAKVINMGYLTYRDIYSTNGASYIRNQPISVEFADAINDISLLRNEFLGVFLNNEGLSDPIYSKIMLGHNCSFLSNSTGQNFCGYLVNHGIKLNIISLLGDYEAIITEKQELFYSSNRTVEALRAIQQDKYELFASTLRTLLDESNVVSARTEAIFETKHTHVKAEAEIILIVSSILLAILALVVWVMVFSGFREGCNQFKNVLKNFPPQLVLSNFVLKNFLNRVSNHHIDLSKSIEF